MATAYHNSGKRTSTTSVRFFGGIARGDKRGPDKKASGRAAVLDSENFSCIINTIINKLQ
jgi:hypothetical protein